MKTAFGARMSIRRSKVPLTHWARVLGIRYKNLHMMVHGSSKMQNGPAMQRARQLVQDLADGKVEWKMTRTRTGHQHWEIVGGVYTAGCTQPRWKADFMKGNLRREVSA